MRIPFTKMQGAGNDFVVLDETRGPIGGQGLTRRQYQWLADRHFGVGADQILIVGPSPAPGIDFSYRIVNADGSEVEQCGNGARCFVRYVQENGLTDQSTVRVQTRSGVIELRSQDDGRVSVDMGAPVFEHARIPFDAAGLAPEPAGDWLCWPVVLDLRGERAAVPLAVLSMGNPHAVLRVDDVDAAPVETLGPAIESHPRFERRVNAGFMQVVDRGRIRLRVYERGAGETLACGTGACAAAVAGMRSGWLDGRVEVETRGGRLTIAWSGREGDAVLMTGPAQTVFTGEIELPELPDA
ncbi:MAG: diaminopimelate epimerase [Comamonas sp.]